MAGHQSDDGFDKYNQSRFSRQLQYGDTGDQEDQAGHQFDDGFDKYNQSRFSRQLQYGDMGDQEDQQEDSFPSQRYADFKEEEVLSCIFQGGWEGYSQRDFYRDLPEGIAITTCGKYGTGVNTTRMIVKKTNDGSVTLKPNQGNNGSNSSNSARTTISSNKPSGLTKFTNLMKDVHKNFKRDGTQSSKSNNSSTFGPKGGYADNISQLQRPALPEGWERCTGPVYYNKTTNVRQWERPTIPNSPLPAGWEESTGEYYYNRNTLETTETYPTLPHQSSQSQGSSKSHRSSHQSHRSLK